MLSLTEDYKHFALRAALALVLVTLAVSLTYSGRPVVASGETPKYIDEYATPTPSAAPLAITADKDGRIWFTESNVSKLGMFDPSNRAFKEYPVPGVGDMWGVLVDKAGYVWLTQYSGKGSVNPGGAVVSGGNGRLVRFNPTDGNFTIVDIPTPGSFPFRLIADERGRIWFTELLGNKIGVFDPVSNELEEYTVPSPFGGPGDLVFDSRGNLWFTEVYNESVAEFQPATKNFMEHHLFTTDPSRFISSPVGITLAPNGNVWFADHGGNWIAEFNPLSQALTRYALGASSAYPIAIPNGILIDRLGRVWFSEHGGNAIGYYQPGTRTMVEYPIPTGPISTALWIAQAPNGNIWFTEWSENKIGVVHADLPAPVSIRTSEGYLRVIAGDETSLSLLTKIAGTVPSNGTFRSSWSSYVPTEIQVTFSPAQPSLTGLEDTAGAADMKVSGETPPGNYTLSIGVDLGNVRVWSVVETEVAARGQAGVLDTSEVLSLFLLGLLVAAAGGIWLFRRRLRSC